MSTNMVTGETIGDVHVQEVSYTLNAFGFSRDLPNWITVLSDSRTGTVVENKVEVQKAPRNPIRTSPNPSDYYALNSALKKASASAQVLVVASEDDDFRAKAIAAIDLLDALRGLWKRRALRESSWADILNFLQSSLAGEKFESEFVQSHALAVKKVVDTYLKGGLVTQSDIDSAVDVLTEAGLDPFKAISFPDEGPSADLV